MMSDINRLLIWIIWLCRKT